jgi:UDP-N-acetyl-D-glucosamine dehydrogenase
LTQEQKHDMDSYTEDFEKRLEAKEIVVAIIGLGYIGTPLAAHFVEAGIRVIGIDADPEKITQLKEGKICLNHLNADWILPAVAENRFCPTSDYELLKDADAIIICVPTPLTAHREPDLSHVKEAGRQIALRLKKGALVSLESTTYPGTTMEVLLPLLSQNGKEVGRDYFLVFSPEREDPGNPVYSVSNIPKVIGGVTERCADLAEALYGTIFERTVRVSVPAAAELSKLLENIFRSVNIALVNEMKVLCDKMGLNVWEVIDAAATKPFGYMPFYPGPGLGGHCIPIDPFYLTWKAREYGFTTRFIELSGEINTSMPHYVISRVIQALNKNGRALNGARVLLLGAAYKKDIGDLRESPSLPLMRLMEQQGALISYNDPYVPILEDEGIVRKSVELTKEALAASHVVLIATAHSCYDPEFILEHAPLVVDTRNMTKNVSTNRHKIVRA